MIQLVIGNREQQLSVFHTLVKEKGFSRETIEHFYHDDYSEENFEERISLEPGLFGDILCYALHGVASLIKKEILAELQASPHYFFFLEEKMLKKNLEIFTNLGSVVHQPTPEKNVPSKNFNVFALADALGERDKKKLWLLYREALDLPVSVEEINGIFFWQLKNLALIHQSPQGVPDMNPYVYNKNLRYSKKYSFVEICTLMDFLAEGFHSRESLNTLELKLEKMILSL